MAFQFFSCIKSNVIISLFCVNCSAHSVFINGMLNIRQHLLHFFLRFLTVYGAIIAFGGKQIRSSELVWYSYGLNKNRKGKDIFQCMKNFFGKYKIHEVSQKIAYYTKTTHQICSSKIPKYSGINLRKSHKILGFYHPKFESYNVFIYGGLLR